MAALDGAVKSLMQGVSQQTPRERLDGQLSLQENMLSDAVRGLRRRPGMRYRSLLPMAGLLTTGATDKVFVTSVDVEDGIAHIVVNTTTGQVLMLDDNFAVLDDTTLPYLVAPNADYIQVAALRGSLYLCNTAQKPVKIVTNEGKLFPGHTGFAYIKAGAYSKMYTLILNVGGTAYSTSFTTVSGQASGDYAFITPEYIATQLVTQLNALSVPGLAAVRSGAYIYLRTTSSILNVSSDAGTYYVGTSNGARVPLVADLPARLPAEANGILTAVGSSDRSAVWYQFNATTQTWNEAGAWNSANALGNMPISVLLDGTWTWDTAAYEGRLSGTDDSNEDPEFIEAGITGMAAYQGRLVLLAGSAVVMSAAGKPRRFYRTTTTELLPSDPIGISSGAASTTNFRYAVPFNKDLLLFSASCQAVVPSGNVALTSSTAQIVITSWYASTTRTSPVVAGRSLLYFGPRSNTFASVLEMVPSNTTDSQYTTNDATQHIPRYIPGDIRQAAASTTSGSVAMLASGDPRGIYLEEYLWSTDDKAQGAWHRWDVPYDVSAVWFVRETVYVGLATAQGLLIVSIEPKADPTFGNGLVRPFSDIYAPINVVGGQFTVPPYLQAALVDNEGMLTYATDTAAPQAVGFSLSPDRTTGAVVRNVPDGVYVFGTKFLSKWAPTPPFVRDQQGTVIGTARTQLIRWEATVEDTGILQATVSSGGQVISQEEYSPLRWSSTELELGYPEVAGSGRIVVPVRVSAQDAETVFSTDGPHDMLFLTLEFVLQYNQRRRRVT